MRDLDAEIMQWTLLLNKRTAYLWHVERHPPIQVTLEENCLFHSKRFLYYRVISVKIGLSPLTHVRNQMQHGVARQRADGQRHQELEEMVVEDLLHYGNDGNAQKPDQTDNYHGCTTVAPYCNEDFERLVRRFFFIENVKSLWIWSEITLFPNNINFLV